MIAPEAVLFPGGAGWELWKFPAKSAPKCEHNPSAKSLPPPKKLLLAIPSRTLMPVPLWVSSEGDPCELAELELSGRHLVRRDAEVRTIPVDSAGGRSLVLAIAIGDDPANEFPKAGFFDIPARMLDPGAADVAVWRESGAICFGFYRSGRCVTFSATGEPSPGPAFCGLLTRLALRLRAEDIIPGLPSTVRLIGDFSDDDRASLAGSLRAEVELVSPAPPPTIPSSPVRILPPSARRAGETRAVFKRFALLGGIGAAVYLLALAALAGDLAVRTLRLQNARAEAESVAPAAEEAKKLVTEWKEFQSAVSPHSFGLDQLAAVATELPGEQVRLTQFTIEGGRIILAGEAPEISQAYQFLERVKKSPVLQDYDWTSRQPQLAGKNKVRFEMEGARPDAKTREE